MVGVAAMSEVMGGARTPLLRAHYEVAGVSLLDEMLRQREASTALRGHIVCAPLPDTVKPAVECGRIIAADVEQTSGQLTDGRFALGMITGCEHALLVVLSLLSQLPSDWTVDESFAAMWLATRVLREQPTVPGELARMASLPAAQRH